MRRLLPALLLLLTVLALRLAASVCSVPSVVHYNAGNELTYWYNDANNNGSWDGNETGANYTYDIEGDRTQQIYQAQMPEPGNTTNAPYITTNTTYSYIQVGRDNFLTVANLTTGWWKSGSNKLQQVAEYSAFSYDDQGRRQFEDRYDYYDYDTDGGHTGYGTIGGNYSGTYYSYNEPVAVKLHDGVSPVRAYTLTASSTGNTGNLSVPAEDWLRGSDWGGGIGGILYSQVEFGNATTASYYHYDGRGDVVALTSNTGNVTYAAAYNAYGTHATVTASNVTTTGTQEVGTDTDPFRTNTREEWDSADGTAFVKEGHRIRGLETDTYLTKDPSIMKQVTGDNYWMINGEKVPEEPTSAAELTYRAMLAMRDGHALAATATPSGSGQDVKVGQDAQFEKIDNADGGAGFESTVHIVHVGNPNWYTYVNANPWTAVDPDGQDAVMLNESDGAEGHGHQAVLIGNDKSGWTYYSKDGKNDNTMKGFKTLKDFEKSDLAHYYDRQYQMSTTPEQDSKMKDYANKNIDAPFAVSKTTDPQTGKVLAGNCSDFVAGVLNAGGLKTQSPTQQEPHFGTFTAPNLQFDQFRQDHSGGIPRLYLGGGHTPASPGYYSCY